MFLLLLKSQAYSEISGLLPYSGQQARLHSIREIKHIFGAEQMLETQGQRTGPETQKHTWLRLSLYPWTRRKVCGQQLPRVARGIPTYSAWKFDCRTDFRNVMVFGYTICLKDLVKLCNNKKCMKNLHF